MPRSLQHKQHHVLLRGAALPRNVLHGVVARAELREALTSEQGSLVRVSLVFSFAEQSSIAVASTSNNDLDLSTTSVFKSMASDQDFLSMKPLGHMRTVFQYKNGTPRQPSLCSTARGSLTIEKSIFNNPEHSLQGLEQYSHAWIIFVFHKNNRGHTKAKVKPPRLNGQRVGVFSTRSPYRPNAIGLTLAKIEQISDATVNFSGIDIVDGTPVLDIKPFIPQYDCPKCGHSISADACQDSKQVFTVGGTVEEFCDTDMQMAENDCVSPESTHGGAEGRDQNSSLLSPQFLSSSETTSICHSGEVKTAGASDSIAEVASPRPLGRLGAVSTGIDESGVETVGRLNSETRLASLGSVLASNNITKEPNCADAESCTMKEHFSSASDKKTVIEDEDTSPSLVPEPLLELGNHSTAVKSGSSTATQETEQGENTSVPPAAVAQWLSSPPVAKLKVTFTPAAENQLKLFARRDKRESLEEYYLDFLSGEDEIRDAIMSVLSEDPRSVYRRKKCSDLLYFFTVDRVHVTCWFDNDRAEVVKVQPVSMVRKLSEKSEKV